MPINKNAVLRYQVLDKCFRNTGRKYCIDDLVEACNEALQDLEGINISVNKRQLYYDIRFMESEQGWSVPLEKIEFGKRIYYRYSEPDFSINNQPLNETEANQIRSAMLVMSRFSGLPQFEWINEIIPILNAKLGLIKTDRQVIEYESNVDLKGLDFLPALFNAIVNKNALKISYKAFKNSESIAFFFHPYYLKQYNNRWFVFGLNDALNNPYWNLAIDRIQSIEDSNQHYIYTEIDWQDYFYDIIGVTKPENVEPEEIILLFNQDSAPYVITKPLHPTQKVKETEIGLEVKIRVIPNFELKRTIMSYGKNATVVSPESLRNYIIENIEECRKNYSEP